MICWPTWTKPCAERTPRRGLGDEPFAQSSYDTGVTILLDELGVLLWQRHVTDLPAALRRSGRLKVDSGQLADVAMDILEYCAARDQLDDSELAMARDALDSGAFGDATGYFADLLAADLTMDGA